MGQSPTGRRPCDSVPPIHGPMAGRQEAGGRDEHERTVGDVQSPDQASEETHLGPGHGGPGRSFDQLARMSCRCWGPDSRSAPGGSFADSEGSPLGSSAVLMPTAAAPCRSSGVSETKTLSREAAPRTSSAARYIRRFGFYAQTASDVMIAPKYL